VVLLAAFVTVVAEMPVPPTSVCEVEVAPLITVMPGKMPSDDDVIVTTPLDPLTVVTNTVVDGR